MMLNVNTTLHDYLSLLGYLFLCHGKTSRAITILEALIALQPENPQAHRSLAYAFLIAGDHQRTLHELEHVTSSGPVDTHDQILRIRALWGLERYAEARQMIGELNGKLRNVDV
jgi:regulator of sirC expression with transglutaminase-like and TPR domain